MLNILEEGETWVVISLVGEPSFNCGVVANRTASRRQWSSKRVYIGYEGT